MLPSQEANHLPHEHYQAKRAAYTTDSLWVQHHQLRLLDVEVRRDQLSRTVLSWPLNQFRPVWPC